MLKELELFRLEKRRLGRIWSMCTNTWKKGVKRTETGSSQWCPVAGLKHTMSFWASENPFSLWGWHSTAHCPEGWWRLPPWRYSKDIWTWSCTTQLEQRSWARIFSCHLKHCPVFLWNLLRWTVFHRHSNLQNKPKVFYRTFTYRLKYPQLYAWEEWQEEN